jgi:hypothetical protein
LPDIILQAANYPPAIRLQTIDDAPRQSGVSPSEFRPVRLGLFFQSNARTG